MPDIREMACHCSGRCVGAPCPCICHRQSALPAEDSTKTDRQIAIIKKHYQGRCDRLTAKVIEWREAAEQRQASIDAAVALIDARDERGYRTTDNRTLLEQVRAALTGGA